jgi:prophage maintenance system killer protein
MSRFMAQWRLNLTAIEGTLWAVQQDFARINRILMTPRDTLDDRIVANMMAGYAYVDWLLVEGIDLLAIGHSRHLLALNALVLCGTDPKERQDTAAHLAATEQRFYDDAAGGIGSIVDWYALHRGDTVWKRAAGVYVRVLSEPQLFIEGNHRTGALIMSAILAREGAPPFVLTADNAKGYFDPSTQIAKAKRTNIDALFRFPRIKKAFAAFLMEQADDRYLMLAPAMQRGTVSHPTR